MLEKAGLYKPKSLLLRTSGAGVEKKTRIKIHFVRRRFLSSTEIGSIQFILTEEISVEDTLVVGPYSTTKKKDRGSISQ